MTAKTNSRVAGFFFLFYIVNGIAVTIVGGRAHIGGVAQHLGLFRVAILLTLLTAVDALALAVAIYGLTRRYDADLAMLALVFRVAEGIVGAMAAVNQTRVLAMPDQPQPGGNSTVIGAFLFAIGSAIYCYIFIRARNIPQWLAWLGFVASLLLCAGLPLQLLAVLQGAAGQVIWIPMAVFEIVFGVWLLVKGVQE